MSNEQLVEILKDEYGLYDTMVFCDIKARYHELIADPENNTDDNHYDSMWYYMAASNLKSDIERPIRKEILKNERRKSSKI